MVRILTRGYERMTPVCGIVKSRKFYRRSAIRESRHLITNFVGIAFDLTELWNVTRREERQIRRILFDHLDEIVEAWNEFQESTND